MTDWVQAMLKKGREAEERKRDEVAKDRVGRNDRLGNGSGGEAKTREVKQVQRQPGTEWARRTESRLWMIVKVVRVEGTGGGSQRPSGPE